MASVYYVLVNGKKASDEYVHLQAAIEVMKVMELTDKDVAETVDDNADGVFVKATRKGEANR